MNRPPDYYQCAPCPKCDTIFYAVPWEPKGVCSTCVERGETVQLLVLKVYIPTTRTLRNHLEETTPARAES